VETEFRIVGFIICRRGRPPSATPKQGGNYIFSKEQRREAWETCGERASIFTTGQQLPQNTLNNNQAIPAYSREPGVELLIV
jgi:hypothetical protein